MDKTDIYKKFKSFLLDHTAILKVRKDNGDGFEVAGTKETMQGKQKVDGIFFASLIPKKKDVRFYFFSIYTHPAEIKEVPAEIKKFLKGKVAFTLKL